MIEVKSEDLAASVDAAQISAKESCFLEQEQATLLGTAPVGFTGEVASLLLTDIFTEEV